MREPEAAFSPRPLAADFKRPTGVAFPVPAEKSRLNAMWILGHAALGVLLRAFPLAAAFHGFLSLLVGLAAAVRGRREGVAAAIGYIAASQVLWRMGQAPIPFMYGMYAAGLLAAVTALRFRERPSAEHLLYLLPLLPSMALTFAAISDAGRTRELVAFNLAGPAALFCVVWCFDRPATRAGWRVGFAMLGPITATAAAALWHLARQEEVRFGTESNFAAAGGYGPNQVASTLSLGLVILVAYLWLGGRKAWRPLTLGLLSFLTVETLLTFSRSGMAMALGAAAAMAMVLLQKPGARIAVLLSAVLLWAGARWVLIPRLETFTGGAFTARYTDPRLSNRDQIALSDLQLFLSHPILGVGPGMGTELRQSMLGVKVAAHTEFTRILAEHGLAGVVSLFALLWTSWRIFGRWGGSANRGWALGMLAWAWLYFSVNAFRTMMPATALMLALAGIPEEDEPWPPGRRRISGFPSRACVGAKV